VTLDLTVIYHDGKTVVQLTDPSRDETVTVNIDPGWIWPGFLHGYAPPADEDHHPTYVDVEFTSLPLVFVETWRAVRKRLLPPWARPVGPH
jgi:hypothetical protein